MDNKKEFSSTGDAIPPDDTYEGQCLFQTDKDNDEEETRGLQEHHRLIAEEEQKRQEEAKQILVTRELSQADTIEIDLSESSAAMRIARDKQLKAQKEATAKTTTTTDTEQKQESKNEPSQPQRKEKGMGVWIKFKGIAIGFFYGLSSCAFRSVVVTKDVTEKTLKTTARASILTSGFLWGNFDFIAWVVSLCLAWRSGYATAISGENDFVSALLSLFALLVGQQLPEGGIMSLIKKPAPEVQRVIKEFLNAHKTNPGIIQDSKGNPQIKIPSAKEEEKK